MATPFDDIAGSAPSSTVQNRVELEPLSHELNVFQIKSSSNNGAADERPGVGCNIWRHR
jgi:hypothetical protein